ncbi:MAG: hypothetical protein PCFJNLEI_00247 [Verrucomicrobiae bacterium]|nr:hypothetical protein [Verrucomicrobiae bacterium]
MRIFPAATTVYLFSLTLALATPARLLLNLNDGSRVIGTTELTTVAVHSASLGELNIPVEKISSARFAADRRSVSIRLSNGDKLEGTLNLPEITLTTVFGKAKIPLAQVRDFQVGGEAGGHAIRLQSANKNYVEFPASDAFDVMAGWTLEFWANISGGKGEMLSPIMRLGDDCGQQAGIQMDIFQQNVRFWARDRHEEGQDVTTKMNILDSQWHHWAGVVSEGQMRFYIDGVRVGSQPYTAGATGAQCPLRIGYRATHGNCYTDGTFDEVRISRVARYDGNFTPTTSFPLDGDTIAYWRFNEGEGATIRDETGKHNGTLHGTTLPIWVEGVQRPSR